MQNYQFTYVMDDGNPKTFKTTGADIFDATKKFENFLRAMAKKDNWKFTSTCCTTFTVIVTPRRGRKTKKA